MEESSESEPRPAESALPEAAPAQVSPIPTNSAPTGAAASLAATVAGKVDGVIRQHIEGTAKPKPGRKRKKQDNAQKIESVFQRIDALNMGNSLVVDTLAYLRTIGGADIQPAIAALEYAQGMTKTQLSRLSGDVNNAAGKTQAQHSHNKLNKAARQKANDLAAQRSVLQSKNPKKALQQSLRDTKVSVEEFQSISSAGEAGASGESIGPLLPRQKKPKNTTEDEPICLPRPSDGRLFYRRLS